MTLHLALLNLMKFTWAYFSSLSRSLWMASSPLGLLTAKLRFFAAFVVDGDIQQYWSY